MPERRGPYAIDGREFASLLDDESTRARLLERLRDWGIALDAADAEAVAAAHAAVQSHPERQRIVYGIAMDLWR